jgi:hypothetical protein
VREGAGARRSGRSGGHERFLRDPRAKRPRLLRTRVDAALVAQSNRHALRPRLFIGNNAPELHELWCDTLAGPIDGGLPLAREDIVFSRYLDSSDWRPMTPARTGLGSINLVPVATQGSATLDGIVATLRTGYDILYLVCHGALIEGEPRRATAAMSITRTPKRSPVSSSRARRRPHCCSTTARRARSHGKTPACGSGTAIAPCFRSWRARGWQWTCRPGFPGLARGESRPEHVCRSRECLAHRSKPGGDMAEQTCPKCGARFRTGDGWAKAAVSLLIPAPAVSDMATQVRCPRCNHLFADGEIRYLSASRFKVARILVGIAVVCVVLWLL